MAYAVCGAATAATDPCATRQHQPSESAAGAATPAAATSAPATTTRTSATVHTAIPSAGELQYRWRWAAGYPWPDQSASSWL